MEERDIIERLLGRDETGLHDLLRYYGPLMRYIIAPIVTDPHDQEDCLSEAAMRVWDRVDQFDPQRGSWTAWLTAVVRNTARNHRRAVQPHHSTQDLDETPPPPSPPRRSCFCGRSGRPPSIGPYSCSPPTSRPSFTENITTYSPRLRLPPNWAPRSGRWRASSTG